MDRGHRTIPWSTPRLQATTKIKPSQVVLIYIVQVCIRYCKPNCNIFHCQIQRPQQFQTPVTRRLVGWQDQHLWQGKELVMEGGGREAVRQAYEELRLAHPELPNQLRDFQVAWATYWRFLCHNLWFCRSTYYAERCIRRRRGTCCVPSLLDMGRAFPCSFLVYSCPKVELERLKSDLRAPTSFVSHYRLHCDHRCAPPHHWIPAGCGMWPPRNPCYGWK